MKKYFLIILALALILSGCKGTSDKTHTSSNSSTLSSVSNNGVESKGESENMSSTDTTVSSAKEEIVIPKINAIAIKIENNLFFIKSTFLIPYFLLNLILLCHPQTPLFSK